MKSISYNDGPRRPSSASPECERWSAPANSSLTRVLRARAGCARRRAASKRRATSAPSARASAGAPVERLVDHLGGVGAADQPAERQAAAGQRGVTGDRRAAADAQAGEQRALGGDGHLGRRVGQRPAQRDDARVVGARLQRQRALPDRRQHARRSQPLGDARREAEAVETGARRARRRRPPPRRPCAAACRRCRAGSRSSGRRAPRAAGRRGAGWRCRRGCPAAARRRPAPERLTIASRGSARVGIGDERQPGGAARRARPSGCAPRVDLAARAAPSSISLTQTPLPPRSITRAGLARGRPAVTMICSLDLEARVRARAAAAAISRGLPARQRAAARADDDRSGAHAAHRSAAFLSPTDVRRSARSARLGFAPRRDRGGDLRSANSRCTAVTSETPSSAVVLAQRHLRRVQQLLGERSRRGRRSRRAPARRGRASPRPALSPRPAPAPARARAAPSPSARAGGRARLSRKRPSSCSTMRLGLGRPRSARPSRCSLADLLQVVDVGQVDAVQLARLRLDVARDGDVEQEQRPPAARACCTCRPASQRQHRPLRARRRDARCRPRQRAEQVAPVACTSAPKRAASSSARGARAVGDGQRRAVRAQRARRQLGHLAGADDQHAPPVEAAEHLARELDRHRADRHRVARDRGLAPHAPRDAERALRSRRSGSAPAVPVLHGGVVRLLDLPQDLRLADDQRIQAGGDAEQVVHRLGVARARRGARRAPAPATPARRASALAPARAARASRVGRRRRRSRRGCRCDSSAASRTAGQRRQLGAARPRSASGTTASRSRTATGAVRCDTPRTRQSMSAPPIVHAAWRRK